MPRTRPNLIERWECDRCLKVEEAPVAAVEMVPGHAPAPPALQGVWVITSFQIANPNAAGQIQPLPPGLFCYACACEIAGLRDEGPPAMPPAATETLGLGTCGHCHHPQALHRSEPREDGQGMEITCGSPACQCRFRDAELVPADQGAKG